MIFGRFGRKPVNKTTTDGGEVFTQVPQKEPPFNAEAARKLSIEANADLDYEQLAKDAIRQAASSGKRETYVEVTQLERYAIDCIEHWCLANGFYCNEISGRPSDTDSSYAYSVCALKISW